MPSFNCFDCGLCCATPREIRTVLLPGDPDPPEEFVVEVKRSFGKTTVKAIKTVINKQGIRVCAAFVGEIGKDARCSIHETKPKHCRNFPVGGSGCLQYRVKLEKMKAMNAKK